MHVHILPRRPNDFRDNDDIYHELRKHDKGLVQWRNEDDMKQEAEKLRHFFKSMY